MVVETGAIGGGPGSVQLDDDVPARLGHHPPVPVRGAGVAQDAAQDVRQVQAQPERRAPLHRPQEEARRLDHLDVSDGRPPRELRPRTGQIHPGNRPPSSRAAATNFYGR